MENLLDSDRLVSEECILIEIYFKRNEIRGKAKTKDILISEFSFENLH
jgi:hypothetical protein